MPVNVMFPALLIPTPEIKFPVNVLLEPTCRVNLGSIVEIPT